MDQSKANGNDRPTPDQTTNNEEKKMTETKPDAALERVEAFKKMRAAATRLYAEMEEFGDRQETLGWELGLLWATSTTYERLYFFNGLVEELSIQREDPDRWHPCEVDRESREYMRHTWIYFLEGHFWPKLECGRRKEYDSWGELFLNGLPEWKRGLWDYFSNEFRNDAFGGKNADSDNPWLLAGFSWAAREVQLHLWSGHCAPWDRAGELFSTPLTERGFVRSGCVNAPIRRDHWAAWLDDSECTLRGGWGPPAVTLKARHPTGLPFDLVH